MDLHTIPEVLSLLSEKCLDGKVAVETNTKTKSIAMKYMKSELKVRGWEGCCRDKHKNQKHCHKIHEIRVISAWMGKLL